MLDRLLQCALEEISRNRRPVLVIIIDAHGSTPRGAGAAMVVSEGRVLAGTIGGGEIEYQCAQLAAQPPKPLMDFHMDHQQAAGLGMVCGGSAQVLFVPLDDSALLENALHQMRRLQPGWLLLSLDGTEPVLETSAAFSPHPELVERDGQKWFSLPLAEPGRIFLMGGGHVSLALSKLLDVLGYPYVVVDDREEFAHPGRFPNAKQTVAETFSELSNVLIGGLRPEARDCICIMTRGHLADADALRFALTTNAGYIGLMGSKRKREQVFDMLAEEGFSDAPERVTTPIGLPIGGQTPEEIAVSIAAQIIEYRYTK